MTVQRPLILRKQSSSILSPFASVPAQRIRAVANAHHLPAVMFSSLMSTHLNPETKQRIHLTSFFKPPFLSIAPEVGHQTSILWGVVPGFHRDSWCELLLPNSRLGRGFGLHLSICRCLHSDPSIRAHVSQPADRALLSRWCSQGASDVRAVRLISFVRWLALVLTRLEYSWS